MKNLWVCALDELPSYLGKHQITHVLTLIDPDVNVTYYTQQYNEFGRKIISFIPGIVKTRINMLDVEGHSIAYDGMKEYVPNHKHVEEIIKFASSFDATQHNVLVHCWAGVSRSTAAALIILYIQNDRNIEVAMKRLLEIRPIAQPNTLICKIADEILGNENNELYNAAKSLESELLKFARAPVDLL